MTAKTVLPSREEFQKLFDASASPVLIDRAKDAVPLIVDYGREFEAMVRAGYYDFVDPRIHPENFSYQRGGKECVIARPVLIEGIVLSEEAAWWLRRMKLEPATLPELLAYGARCPDKQRKHAVIALGTLFGGSLVPYLGGGPENRDLGLERYDGGWLGGACRFLGISTQ